KTSGWIQEGGNWIIFYIEKKTPAKAIPVDDTMKTWVQRQLAIQRALQSTDLGKRLTEKLKTSKVDVQLVSLKEPWKRAFDSLQTSDATQGTQGQTSAPTPPSTTTPSATPSSSTSKPAAPTTGTTTGH